MLSEFENLQPSALPAERNITIVPGMELRWSCRWEDEFNQALDLDGHKFRIWAYRGNRTLIDFTGAVLTAGQNVSSLIVPGADTVGITGGQAKVIISVIDNADSELPIFIDSAVVVDA